MLLIFQLTRKRNTLCDAQESLEASSINKNFIIPNKFELPWTGVCPRLLPKWVEFGGPEADEIKENILRQSQQVVHGGQISGNIYQISRS